MNLRVLHIIDHMRVGGAQRIVKDLVGFHDHAMMYSIKPVPPDKAGYFLSGQCRTGNVRTGLEFPSMFKELVGLIELENIDIVHCHLRGSFMVGLVLKMYFRLRRREGPKFVFHEHSIIMHNSRPYKLLLRIIARYGRLISCSDTVRDLILRTGVDGAGVITIRNYVKPDTFYPSRDLRNAFRQKWGLAERDFVIGFAGRLVPEKGCHTLVDAFAWVSGNERMKLFISGNGPRESALRHQISNYRLSSRVTMLGYVEDMNGFYNGIDLLVFPSLQEPFGMVQLEAQAAGTPVVASDIPATRESLGEANAIFFPAGDADALGKMLERVAGEREQLEAFRRPAMMNAARFSFDSFLKQIEAVYRTAF